MFTGFSPETLTFLTNLAHNNNKSWFDAHKPEYQQHLLEPLQGLVTALRECMLKIDPFFDVSPAVNRTISRIYRDTRFAKDKSPYKTTMWITFKRPNKNWQDAPAYFFEIGPDAYRYGMGFYSASKTTMDTFRATIDDRPQVFLQAIAFYTQQTGLVVEGDLYKKRVPSAHPPEIQEWYQRKNLYVVCNREPDALLFSEELSAELSAAFQRVAPLYHYLWQIVAQ